jgi:hypothetical protein
LNDFLKVKELNNLNEENKIFICEIYFE